MNCDRSASKLYDYTTYVKQSVVMTLFTYEQMLYRLLCTFCRIYFVIFQEFLHENTTWRKPFARVAVEHKNTTLDLPLNRLANDEGQFSYAASVVTEGYQP